MLILLVEDDEVAARALARLLDQMGHQAIAVGSGAETLDVVSTLKPDCMVLDCELPDCSGLDLLEQLRQHPHLSDLPIIFFSGLEDPAAPARARTFKRVDWVAKRHGALALLDQLSTLQSP